MKRKIKTFSKNKKQESILKNSNFLNSQNYILSNKKKRKIELYISLWINNKIDNFTKDFWVVKEWNSNKIKFKNQLNFFFWFVTWMILLVIMPLLWSIVLLFTFFQIIRLSTIYYNKYIIFVDKNLIIYIKKTIKK